MEESLYTSLTGDKSTKQSVPEGGGETGKREDESDGKAAGWGGIDVTV